MANTTIPVALALLSWQWPEIPALAEQPRADALADAIAWRLHGDRPCPRCADSLCESCSTDWDQADRYHALARALGATGDPQRPANRWPAAETY